MSNVHNIWLVNIVRCFEEVDVCDPWVSVEEVKKEYGMALVSCPDYILYDAVILAVPHNEFLTQKGKDIRGMIRSDAVLYDVKSVLSKDSVDGRL